MGHASSRKFPLRGGGEVSVRSGGVADAAALMVFERHLAAHDPFPVREGDELVQNEAEFVERVRKHAEGEGSIVLLAEAEGGIVGELFFRAGDRRKLAHHGSFGISAHADWRGRGVGRALITTLLDWAAAGPTIEKVCLGVFATNERAIALYRRMGFVEEGRRPLYFKLGPGRYVDDIQMSIWVKPGLAPPGFSTHRPPA